MKKYFTLLAITTLILFSTGAKASIAGDDNFSAEKKKALTSLIKQVDRSIINELQLNEMQYIQLRTVNKKYNEESLKVKTTEDSAALVDSKIQELNNKYLAEISTILTSQQIATFINKQSIALK
jgi:hypothetical protein